MRRSSLEATGLQRRAVGVPSRLGALARDAAGRPEPGLHRHGMDAPWAGAATAECFADLNRRLSLDSDGAASASERSRGQSLDLLGDVLGPGLRNVSSADAVFALLRREYHKRIATQVWLSNLAPVFHYLGGSFLVWRAQGSLLHWNALQLQKLLCGLFSLALLVLCSLKKASALLPPRWQPDGERIMSQLIRLEALTYVVLNVAGFYEFHALRDANCPGAHAAACGQRYLFSFHTGILPKWIISQITARYIFFIEILRTAAFTLATLALAAADGSLTPGGAALVLAEAPLCFLYSMLVIKMCRARVFEDRHLPRVETCPHALMPAREAFARRLEAFVTWLLDEPVLDFNTVAGIATGSVLVCRMYGDESLFSVSAAINIMFLALMLTSLVSKLIGGTLAGLRSMAHRLGLGAEQRALFDMRTRLSQLPSEAAILRAASAALQELLPRASATAIATFPPPEGGAAAAAPASAALAGLEASASSPDARAALDASLGVASVRGTSVAFVCREVVARGSRLAVAFSADFPNGTNAFSDWRAAAAAGLIGDVVTAPLSAGPAVVGFITAHLSAATGASAGAPAGADGGGRAAALDSEVLREFCEIVGAAIFCARAQDALQTSQSIVHDIFPQHVAKALAARAREGAEADIEEDAEATATGSDAASDPAPTPPRLSQSSGDGESATATAAARRSRFSAQLFAEAFPSVTIVFADIVGFTKLAEQRSPEAVMAMLHEAFSRFDALCTAHGVYKVETIGDCYMAVSGLLPRRSDHARAAVRFALAMLDAIAAVDVGDGSGVTLRIGLHAGPVTAGLIGRTRARYCLFGDSVNTASRMESSGVPGALQMTAATAALCGLPEGLLQRRTVEVKSKGLMDTALLEAGTPAAAEVLRLLSEPAVPGGGA